MGLFDGAQRGGPVPTVNIPGCPDPANHYVTAVDRGFTNIKSLAAALNTRYAQGYRLAQAFEQAGNTVTIFEHNHP